MRILQFDIPTELEDNSFILSLEEQAKDTGTLGINQIVALKTMLGIEVLVEPFEFQTVKKYKQYFYRPDYHGDMLQDYSFAYDVPEDLLLNKIQDAHAAQYSAEAYVNEYKFVEEVTIPKSVTNVSYYMNIFYEDFDFLVNKINRNKFRSVRTRNTAVHALNSLTSGNPDEYIISRAIFKVKY